MSPTHSSTKGDGIDENTAFSDCPDAAVQAIKLQLSRLRAAKSICILTGAGISAESGIPTFRDKQTGLWENYRAEELANIAAFERDPKTVWSWYQWRRQLVQDKLPNPAHYALAQWQAWAGTQGQNIDLVTQNVDDLHETAGSEVIHLHGHLWQNKCSQCELTFEEDVDYANNELLRCEACAGYVRPNIVWFGEGLPQKEWQAAELAAKNCAVFISIGTSSLVYPAAGLAQLAKQHGAYIIEINLNPTQSAVVDSVLAGKAGEIIPALVAQLIT